MSGSRRLQARRVTVIVESDDHMEAWQVDRPVRAKSLIQDMEDTLPDWYYDLTSDPRRLHMGSSTVTVSLEIHCGTSGCVVARTAEGVAEMLARIGEDET